MNFIGSLCFAVLLCSGGLEHCVTNNGIVYQIQGEVRKAIVLGRIKCAGERMIDLAIPGRVMDFDVVGIKEDAFLNDVNLCSVKIENDIWWIGDRAFKGCSKLAQLVLPDSLNVLGHEAFMDCIKINEVRLPSRLSADSGSWAFRGCEGLRRVVLADGLSCNIVPFFCGCAGITEFAIGSNQQYRMVDGCLYDRSGQTFIRCPNKSTLSNVCVCAGVKYISDYAFFGCRKLKHVRLPDSVSEIGVAAFCMSGLEELKLPDGVGCLYMDAFAGCTNLHSVYMPRGIKYIGANCFSGANNLQRVVFKGDKPEIEDEETRIKIERCVVNGATD